MSTRVRSYLRSNLLGLIAIFIALSGTAIALPGTNTVDSGDIKAKNVKTSDIAANAVNSTKVADNSLTGADVNEATLQGFLTGIPEGSVTAGKLAAGAVPADGTGSDGSTKIATDAIDTEELSDSSVHGATVLDGTLRKADIGVLTGVFNFDPPNILAGNCVGVSSAVPGAQDGDIVIANDANPGSSSMVVHPFDVATANAVELLFCNQSGAPLDLGEQPWRILLIR